MCTKITGVNLSIFCLQAVLWSLHFTRQDSATCTTCCLKVYNLNIFGSSTISTEVLHTPSSTRLRFELMTSRYWQYASCHWDACSNHLAISDFPTAWSNDYCNLYARHIWVQCVWPSCKRALMTTYECNVYGPHVSVHWWRHMSAMCMALMQACTDDVIWVQCVWPSCKSALMTSYERLLWFNDLCCIWSVLVMRQRTMHIWQTFSSLHVTFVQ